MAFFDKGRPVTKEICEFCKKEITPGEKMILSTICPSHERQLFGRFYEPSFYSHFDNIPKYHEKCFYSQFDKKKK